MGKPSSDNDFFDIYKEILYIKKKVRILCIKIFRAGEKNAIFQAEWNWGTHLIA